MFLKPLLEKSDAAYQLVNRRNGRVVAQAVSTAFDSASRRKGLLGRDSLASGAALVIAPTNAIHTWFMRFPIDVVFLDRDLTVLKLKEHLGPWGAAAHRGAHSALELPAGEASRAGIAIGDRLAWGSLEPTPS